MKFSIVTRLEGKSIRDILAVAPQFIRHVATHRAIAAYYKRQLHADPACRAERRREALALLSEGGTILFLCHGNICRSPFAERYARQRLAARGIDDLTVESAGFTALNDPTSPPAARTVSAAHGLDLTDHRADKADAEVISAADLILVMDYRNYHGFTKRYPAADRMFLLGLFDEDAPMEIADPYGAGQSAFADAYDAIRDCVDGLISAYERAPIRDDPDRIEEYR